MIDAYKVLGWLNTADDRSHMAKEAKWLSWAARKISHSPLRVKRMLVSLQELAQESKDPLEKAEICLHRAAIEYYRDWFPEAASHAGEAIIAYENDDHRRAVALWISGMAQWAMFKNHVAHSQWDQARQIFKNRQFLFQHLREQKIWYRNRVRQMEIELAEQPEEIGTWLNCLGYSGLKPSSQDIVNAVQEKVKKRAYPTMYALIRDFQHAYASSENGYERAEIDLQFGLAVYQMGNIPSAIELLRKSVLNFFPGIGICHKQVVARCMLGALEWMAESQHKQAKVDWTRSIQEFEELRLQAAIDGNSRKSEWYAHHRDILQSALYKRLLIDA